MYNQRAIYKELQTPILGQCTFNSESEVRSIRTPTVYMVNFENNSIYMEEIQDAITVKDYISSVHEEDRNRANVTLIPLAEAIGAMLSKMHENNIIHGDLTTSNILLQGDPSDLKLVLIDFGLSSFEASAEDKGVDLYVLERAFLSSHPNTQQLFDAILNSYSSAVKNSKKCKEALAKLDEVRLRGRKRTMVG
uniref:non-specific serine/threonine protein kinase n=1 Tax=Arion vulgaris TaxID=1028688 RepID=A0A0B6ZBN0_9EUPU